MNRPYWVSLALSFLEAPLSIYTLPATSCSEMVFLNPQSRCLPRGGTCGLPLHSVLSHPSAGPVKVGFELQLSLCLSRFVSSGFAYDQSLEISQVLRYVTPRLAILRVPYKCYGSMVLNMTLSIAALHEQRLPTSCSRYSCAKTTRPVRSVLTTVLGETIDIGTLLFGHSTLTLH